MRGKVMVRTAKHYLLAAIVAAAFMYSGPGWCPPPPGFLLPDYVTMDFGNVAIGDTARMQIVFRWNPSYPYRGPATINSNPYFLYPNSEGTFVVDVSQSTCVTGLTLYPTSTCTLTMTFTPKSELRWGATQFALYTCDGLTTSCPTSINRGTTINFLGTGVPPAVPTLSVIATVLLAATVAVLGGLTIRRRIRPR